MKGKKITGKIMSINISKDKGGKKSPVSDVIVNNQGIKGDGHSGDWQRQISLLSMESIVEVNIKGVKADPGDFAENLTVSGLDMTGLKIGDRLEVKNVGGNVILEITQIGKECLHPCRIYFQMGSCIMPQEGIFSKIIEPGKISVGDSITRI
ncbi:MOSC domain-containing protein [Actinomycetota bacterium]